MAGFWAREGSQGGLGCVHAGRVSAARGGGGGGGLKS